MISMKALVVGAVGAGCISAAGLGGYLAVRTGSVDSAAAPATGSVVEVKAQPTEPATVVPAPQAALPAAPPSRPAALPRPSAQVPPASTRTERASTRTSPMPEVIAPRPTPGEHVAEPVASPPSAPEPTHTAGPVDEIQIPSP